MLALLATYSLCAPAPYAPPPVYRITASSLHDAGLQHGRLARKRISGWLATEEMRGVINFTSSSAGQPAFLRMKEENSRAFPELAREIEGMAVGSRLPLDEMWAATLINELESLMTNGGGQWPPSDGSLASPRRAGHCSDVYAVSEGGGYAHGHNEDWPGPIWQFWYFVAYTAAPGAEFESCAGMVYPGGLVGWAGTWNAHGVYLTQNSLFPRKTLEGGLSSAFMQRNALCGTATAGKGLDAIIGAMTAPHAGVGWSSGASVNLVSLHERRMANVEVHEARHSVHEVRMDGAANYSHFNMYKHLEVGVADGPENSTLHRQARVDALPPARSLADVKARLSDTADSAYPIFRDMTLTSLVLDGASGRLNVWCCHHSALDGPPAYSWSLKDFFVGAEDDAPPPTTSDGKQAATVFFNASVVHTMSPTRTAEAWCVDVDGRYRGVGTLATATEACGPRPRRVNLRGAVVVPGLIDSHLHLLYGGFKLARAQLDNASSAAEVASILSAHVAKHPLPPGAWLQAFGWDQERFPSKRFPSRADLDKAFPSTPVWLLRIDGHAAWANSAALRLIPPLPKTDPEGGRIVRDNATGEPTGIFTDTAMHFVADHVPKPTHSQSAEALQLGLSSLSHHGLTAIHDPGIGLEEIPLLQEAIDSETFPLRTYAMVLANGNELGEKLATPDTPKIHSYKGRLTVQAVKFFLDGALGSRGAALLQNYTDRPEQRGQLRLPEDQFKANTSAWVAAGWQVATHAIGDRANRLVLDAYSKACEESASRSGTAAAPDLRLRIEHYQIVNVTDLPRVHHPGETYHGGSACILASMQPTHATSDMVFAEDRLGPARLQGAYAWQSVLDSGAAALPFGSDWPTVGVVPPLLGIYAAVTREDVRGSPPGGWLPKQCVSREQALRGYTVDAAFAAFQEEELGQIADGFFGDFVALDRDILDEASTPEDQIWQTAVLGTWTGGRVAWEHPCWRRAAAGDLPPPRRLRTPAGSSPAARGLAAVRECVEDERAKAPPLESTLERLRRLSAAHGDGCPF